MWRCTRQNVIRKKIGYKVRKPERCNAKRLQGQRKSCRNASLKQGIRYAGDVILVQHVVAHPHGRHRPYAFQMSRAAVTTTRTTSSRPYSGKCKREAMSKDMATLQKPFGGEMHERRKKEARLHDGLLSARPHVWLYILSPLDAHSASSAFIELSQR